MICGLVRSSRAFEIIGIAAGILCASRNVVIVGMVFLFGWVIPVIVLRMAYRFLDRTSHVHKARGRASMQCKVSRDSLDDD
jgi:hypothetical protein